MLRDGAPGIRPAARVGADAGLSARHAVFRAAAEYHAALAAYVHAMRSGLEVEDFAQTVVGAGIEYRLALDRLIADEPANGNYARRAKVLRRLLHQASAKYNLLKRNSPLVAAPPD